jgi:hypothetical protein
MPCAIGLRAHSGWAVAVGVASASPEEPPEVVLRERIGLTDPKLAGSKAPYHAAEKLPLEEAAAFLARCETSSRALARSALERIVARLRTDGRAPVRCGLLLAAGRPLPDLRSTLASHAWIHVGDGLHFRSALADAAAACGLEVRSVRERDVPASLGGSSESVDDYLARQRRLLGPPWAQDQKLAALAAWFALRT